MGENGARLPERSIRGRRKSTALQVYLRLLKALAEDAERELTEREWRDLAGIGRRIFE